MSENRPTPSSDRQPLPVWCGLTIRGWLALLRQRPTIERAFWKRSVAVTAASIANSVFGAAERVVFARRIDRTVLAHPPIFILGHWRSGTTFLHQLLASDPQFSAPNLYQCSFPEHFLVTENWLAPMTAWLQPRTRPMDAVRNSWDAPAEEEIALMLLTFSSPYLVSAFPDAPQRAQRFDSLAKGLSPKELDHWKQAYVRLLKKLTLGSDKPLVLKSPANTSRVPLLLDLFPNARFIHIVRNPYAVFSSTLHLHRVLSRDNSFTATAPVDLEERVLSSYLAMYHSYHLYRVKIPAHARYELRFEDLEADPVGELRKIYRHLNWSGADQIQERLAGELAQHRAFRKNTFQLPEETRRRVAERWEPAFLRYGYPLDGPPPPLIEPVSDQASSSRSRPE